MTRAEDSLNLRRFEQKRRFGVDVLYPTERQVNALTQPELRLKSASLDIENCSEELVPNPQGILPGNEINGREYASHKAPMEPSPNKAELCGLFGVSIEPEAGSALGHVVALSRAG